MFWWNPIGMESQWASFPTHDEIGMASTSDHTIACRPNFWSSLSGRTPPGTGPRSAAATFGSLAARPQSTGCWSRCSACSPGAHVRPPVTSVPMLVSSQRRNDAYRMD